MKIKKQLRPKRDELSTRGTTQIQKKFCSRLCIWRVHDTLLIPERTSQDTPSLKFTRYNVRGAFSRGALLCGNGYIGYLYEFTVLYSYILIHLKRKVKRFEKNLIR